MPEHDAPPEILKLLAHELRWSLLMQLAAGDYRVNELVERVTEPANLVSYHLKKLRDEGVVTARRSDADARDIYYSLDIEALRSQYQAAGNALHPALGAGTTAVQLPLAHLPALRVLFICTHNSARSQMAAALLRQQSGGQVAAFSAGSHPTSIHPETIRTMASLYGIDLHGERTTHVDEFAGQAFDYVITVCDHAREICPTFPGGVLLHWGFPDPAQVEPAAARAAAFQQTARRLCSRVQHFLTGLVASN